LSDSRPLDRHRRRGVDAFPDSAIVPPKELGYAGSRPRQTDQQLKEAIGEFVVDFATTELTIVRLTSYLLEMSTVRLEFICRDFTADMVQKLARRSVDALKEEQQELKQEAIGLLNRFIKLTEFRNKLSHGKFSYTAGGVKFGRVGGAIDEMFAGTEWLSQQDLKKKSRECCDVSHGLTMWFPKTAAFEKQL